MKINQAGLDIIKRSEGCKLTAYLCPGKIVTIGWGHTSPDVFIGQRITQDEADALLANDLAAFERGVSNPLGDIPTTHNQFSAMVSLAYNIGLTKFNSSSVLRYHKAGRHQLAAASFLLWVKAKGRKLTGLVTRRNAERSLYVS